MLIKKEIKTHNGLFRIGSNDKADFVLRFIPCNAKGVHIGKKHFCSLDEAECYVHLLNLTGFTLADL